MEPLGRETVAERIERLEALDAVAEPLQKAVRSVVPQESAWKDLLSGTWLGHPVHPPLTDVVVGAWTSALLLDLLGGGRAKRAADRLVGTGILAAAAGLSDWAELRGGTRRVGTVHASGNVTALVLHTLSWRARRRGQRGQGLALSALGYGVATFSAWLGGHLSFGRGVGVNQTAFEEAPPDWTPVLEEAQLEESTLVGVRANGVGVLLVRKDGRTYALADRCSHRGCALHEGQLGDDTVTCPCHGSTFRLDGSVAKGPATAPQPTFDVRTMEGTVEVRRPEAI
jgi:nitrite reductase/ring-hydroxylating ferredoxin subunit